MSTVATKKISITLDEEIVDELRAKVGTRGLSAYINDKLKFELQGERIDRWLEEFEERNGPIPPEVQAEVDRTWPRF